MYSGDKNSTYDRGCGEKLRFGEILRLEGFGGCWFCERYLDLLGQKVFGNSGLGGGPIFNFL